MRLFVYDMLVNVNVIYYVHVCDMLVNVNVKYYVHVCQQARWARSAGNSAIENLCIILIFPGTKANCINVFGSVVVH